ncbi:MAG: hypothetical protein GY803_15100 [Chloroflexi bacterium]|nr:hypothetical protein [Chloroflexota bacterium]
MKHWLKVIFVFALFVMVACASLGDGEATREVVMNGGETAVSPTNFPLGSLIGILESDDFYFAHMHFNPSAGWTLVLTQDLELHDVLYGKVRQLFANGTAVYTESIIHFAPTHYTLINVYDPETKESRRIFPREPHQALWLEHMKIVEQAEWWARETVKKSLFILLER